MSVFVDPWSLTWKGEFEDVAAVEAYVERLTDIFDLSQNHVISLAISDEAADLLLGDGVYPLAVELPHLMWPNRADVYRLVASLLERLPKLSRLGVRSVLVEDVSHDPELNFAVSEKHARHIDDLAAFLLIAVEQARVQSPMIFSSHANDGSSHCTRLRLADVECSSPIDARLGNYSGRLNFKPSVKDCLVSCDAGDLLSRGFLQEAIAIQVWKDRGCVDPDPLAIDGWSVGKEFARSVGDCLAGDAGARSGSLLRACSRVIRRDVLQITHALRTSSGGGASQVVRSRDGASAWRADIDYEYHLHYWVSSGRVELANMVVHNDFRITA